MNPQPNPAPVDAEAKLLDGLLEHFGGPGSFVPFGTIAHLARLYVICDQQMQARQWSGAYRTILALYRIERDLHASRPPAPMPVEPPPRPCAAPPRPATPAPPLKRPVPPMTARQLEDALVALTGVQPLPRDTRPPLKTPLPPVKRPDS